MVTNSLFVATTLVKWYAREAISTIPHPLKSLCRQRQRDKQENEQMLTYRIVSGIREPQSAPQTATRADTNFHENAFLSLRHIHRIYSTLGDSRAWSIRWIWGSEHLCAAQECDSEGDDEGTHCGVRGDFSRGVCLGRKGVRVFVMRVLRLSRFARWYSEIWCW